jgi:tRNA(fMet)-specific endonuclease VapC
MTYLELHQKIEQQISQLPPEQLSLVRSVFNYFAPKDKSKRRNFSIENLGFSDHDLWIAATAIQHNLTLVSADSDFQRIHQVQPFSLESWV